MLDVDAIYTELEGLQVHLEHTPELGPEYLKGKLVECRVKSNRAADLLVEVNRAYSAARHACVALEALIRTVPATGHDRAQLDLEKVQREDLKFLSVAVSVRRQNLSRTASDIRLLVEILKAGVQGQPHVPELPHRGPVLGPMDAVDGLLSQQQDEVDFAAVFRSPGGPARLDDATDVDVRDLLGED